MQDLDPLGDAALTYSDTNGLPWMASDGLSRRVRAFFDGKGNMTKAVAPDDSTYQFSYNGFGEVTKYIDPTNATTTFNYNGNGDLTQIINALSATTTIVDPTFRTTD